MRAVTSKGRECSITSDLPFTMTPEQRQSDTFFMAVAMSLQNRATVALLQLPANRGPARRRLVMSTHAIMMARAPGRADELRERVATYFDALDAPLALPADIEDDLPAVVRYKRRCGGMERLRTHGDLLAVERLLQGVDVAALDAAAREADLRAYVQRIREGMAPAGVAECLAMFQVLGGVPFQLWVRDKDGSAARPVLAMEAAPGATFSLPPVRVVFNAQRRTYASLCLRGEEDCEGLDDLTVLRVALRA